MTELTCKIRTTILCPDGTEGLYAFFQSIDEARFWITYYLDHPTFAGYTAVIESQPVEALCDPRFAARI